MGIVETHQKWMSFALDLARKAESLGEVPVGAVIVKDSVIIGKGYNQPILSHDPSAHAEIIALRNAAHHLKNYRLPGCSIYVTIEPCAMCAGALIHARLEQLIFATTEPKAGAVVSHFKLLESAHLNHQISIVSGVLEGESRALITNFFRRKRQSRKLNTSLSNFQQ